MKKIKRAKNEVEKNGHSKNRQKKFVCYSNLQQKKIKKLGVILIYDEKMGKKNQKIGGKKRV